jgi:hypothetical protein
MVLAMALIVQIHDTQFAEDWPGALVLLTASVFGSLGLAAWWVYEIQFGGDGGE